MMTSQLGLRAILRPVDPKQHRRSTFSVGKGRYYGQTKRIVDKRLKEHMKQKGLSNLDKEGDIIEIPGNLTNARMIRDGIEQVFVEGIRKNKWGGSWRDQINVISKKKRLQYYKDAIENAETLMKANCKSQQCIDHWNTVKGLIPDLLK
jgi:hypothetical protein